MIISVIGDCDKRPVIYCMIKVMQEFGSVLYLTSNSSALRLTPNRLSGEHYQNTMVVYTEDGFDDYFDNCGYTPDDFGCVLLDNVECAEADLTVYVAGMVQSPAESAVLEYTEEYSTINLFSRSVYDGSIMRKVEEFEAFSNLCPMPYKVVSAVVPVLSKLHLAESKALMKIANREGAGAQMKKRRFI